MRIDAVGVQPSASPVVNIRPKELDSGFDGTIKQALENVSELQANADQLATRLAAGDAVEIHQAMIAMQKASTALQFTVQVRNKVIEAYQEVMRMQV